MADHAPYFVFGLGATYPVNESWQLGFYIINGYNYLSHINNQPSYGSQAVWKPSTRLTLTENLYYGPDQSNTSIEFWRFFQTVSSNGKMDRSPLLRRTMSAPRAPPSFRASLGPSGQQEHSMPIGTSVVPGAWRSVLSFIGIATQGSAAPNNSSQPSRQPVNTDGTWAVTPSSAGLSIATTTRATLKVASSRATLSVLGESD